MALHLSISSSDHDGGRTVWRFLLRAGVMAVVPLLIAVGVYVWYDPFKVLRWTDAPFADGLIVNKGVISVNAYRQYMDVKEYDSFILGSSVSINYPVREWSRYLPAGARPLHIDSSAQTVNSLRKFVEYLDRNAARMDNALVVFAPEVFDMEYDSDNLALLLPPDVESGEFMYGVRFHYRFFKGFARFRYMWPYMKYRYTGVRSEPYDGVRLFDPEPMEYESDINEESCPVWDEWVERDPSDFFKGRYNAYIPSADAPYALLQHRLTDEQKVDLEAIASVFRRRGTDYRVIVAPTPPLYCLYADDDEFLRGTFGSNYVNLTREFREEQSDSTNFYDRIHYRVPLALKYMDRAYGGRKLR